MINMISRIQFAAGFNLFSCWLWMYDTSTVFSNLPIYYLIEGWNFSSYRNKYILPYELEVRYRKGLPLSQGKSEIDGQSKRTGRFGFCCQVTIWSKHVCVSSTEQNFSMIISYFTSFTDISLTHHQSLKIFLGLLCMRS